MLIDCKISLGELVDKISILRIKKKFLDGTEKLMYVDKENLTLTRILNDLKLDGIDSFLNELIEVNTKLWKIEDDIREKERNGEFDQDFIKFARSVYITNDERFRIKNRINESYGSDLREVKSYKKY
ncbi:MAG: hypothetical protein KAQ98_09610 [Bacteriovoracaceae bacterium]|nr:hypothetical protein [Bacteriovoracaceae bacterium]